MMKFSLAKLPGTIDTFRLTIICPHCERGFALFHTCPARCPHCDKGLPNIAALMKLQNDRLIYHQTGETINHNREFKI